MSKAAITAAIKAATKQQWTTDELNIWNQPGDKAKLLGELEAGKKVLVTGREMWGRTEIVLKGESRWVTDGYLSDEKPPALGGACTKDPCPTAASRAASPTAPSVHRAVCNAFPEITSYGGWGGGGEHASGRAVDIMVSGVELGTAVADFVRAHASGCASPTSSGPSTSGRRPRRRGLAGMPSRGSATANHYDHVHVSVF